VAAVSTVDGRFAVVSAVHLLLVRDQHVLLLRRYNTGYEDGNYSVPAGHLDGGEPVSQAMAREAFEETGIVIDHADLSVVHVMHRATPGGERIDFFLSASRWVGEPTVREPDKCDELSWHPLAALPGNTIPYVAAALSAYRTSSRFSEYGWMNSSPALDRPVPAPIA
jgi:8-oxo-dGTP diphosphatase